MISPTEWERVPNPEMPVVGLRNAHGVLTVQFGYKAGVGYLKRNPGYGPPWVRPASVPVEVQAMLQEAP